MSCCKKCPYTDKNCVHSLPICMAYEKEYKPLTAIRCKIEVRNEENKIHQTNADRIRSMSDEELADFIRELNECCLAGAGMVDCSNNTECIDCKGIVLEWLQSEVEET